LTASKQSGIASEQAGIAPEQFLTAPERSVIAAKRLSVASQRLFVARRSHYYCFLHTEFSCTGAVVVYVPTPLARYLPSKSPRNGF
jgi:hypothetical protein